MIKLSGELRFSKELKATEIVALSSLLNATDINLSKPNKGILPFKFTEKFDALTWSEEEAYEVEQCIKVIIGNLPEEVCLNGVLLYENPDEFSYKIHVENNKITVYQLKEEIEKVPTLLRCPHCQKVFKKEDFKEEQNFERTDT